MQKKENIENISIVTARKLVDAGGEIEMETVLLNGSPAWRVNIHMPNDPKIYRVVVYHTLEEKYYKNLTTAFSYFTEMMPDRTDFTVKTRPVEEITTD